MSKYFRAFVALSVLGFSLSSSVYAVDPADPTEDEMRAAEQAAGPVKCSMAERLPHCREKSKTACAPGNFGSSGHTRKECKEKVTKLCKELCEDGSRKKPTPRGPCQCGPVLFDQE